MGTGAEGGVMFCVSGIEAGVARLGGGDVLLRMM